MKKILIVEGNLREENQSFTDGGIKTHTESLKDSIAYFTDKIEIDVVNPSSDKNISEKVADLDKYDGLIWGGSSLNIYNDTIEIRRQIEFMRECQKKIISYLLGTPGCCYRSRRASKKMYKRISQRHST